MKRLERKARRGFTLVELLVVIAIIGVLVALLLPAVQAAREAARRCACQNNLTQLGLAVQNYEFTYEKLPAGVINPDGPIRSEPVGQHVSWIVQILPYIEERAIYDRFNIEAGAYDPVNAELVAAEIQTVQCPSSGDPFTNESSTVARSSYAGCHHNQEAPIAEDNKGLLFLNSAVTFQDIYDGASRTLLLSEARTDPNGLGWASGTRATLRNTSSLNAAPGWVQRGDPNFGFGVQFNDGADNRFNGPDLSATTVGGFASLHPGVVVAAFADGSTRVVRKDLAPEVLEQIGARADGEIPLQY